MPGPDPSTFGGSPGAHPDHAGFPPASGPSDAGGSKRPSAKLLGVVAVVVVIGLLAFMLLGRGGGGGTAGGGDSIAATYGEPLRTVPSSEPRELFSERLDEYIEEVDAIDGRFIVVMDSDRGPDVIALDRNGDVDRNWRYDHDAWSVRVLGDNLLIGSGDGIDIVDPTDGSVRGSFDGNTYEVALLRDGGLLASAYSGYEDHDGDYGDHTHRLTRISARDGSEEWSAEGIIGQLCGDRLLVEDGSDYYFRVLDASTGDELWERPGDAATCGDGFVTISDDDEVTAYDLGSGDERWSVRGDQVLVAIDGVVLTTRGSDGLTALDARSGDEVWSTRQEFVSAEHGRVVVRRNGRLQVLRARSGDELETMRGDWTFPVDGGWFITDGSRSILHDVDGNERWTTRATGMLTDGHIVETDGERLTVWR